MAPTRNNRGESHENGAVEGPRGYLKRALEDALLLRGSRDFEDLAGYRAFVDEVVARRNSHRRTRIDAERAALRPLPPRPTDGCDTVRVWVTSSGGFTLRRVFYSVPSRLVGHQITAQVYDDGLELFLGTTPLETLRRGRPRPDGYGHVVDYRHVIHALRRKPMALRNLVYRDPLFPRDAYRRAFDALLDARGERVACRAAVALMSLAHERGCEAALARELDACLDAGGLLDPDALAARFAPDPQRLPAANVELGSLADYDVLLSGRPAATSAQAAAGCAVSAVDAAQVDLMLTELRMPTVKAVWRPLAERADTEGWPAARLLAALIEQEIAERARRRFERHLAEARLPPGKTLANFEFDAVPMVSRAHVNALVAGDRWLDQGANLILIGNPGGGKSQVSISPRR